jgi:methylated-DNA-[protein]-cysteine S-methyltransferase
MARNPWPIVVPCHRVVGHDGSLTGFGGGVEMKRRMLQLEGATLILIADDSQT